MFYKKEIDFIRELSDSRFEWLTEWSKWIEGLTGTEYDTPIRIHVMSLREAGSEIRRLNMVIQKQQQQIDSICNHLNVSICDNHALNMVVMP